MKKENEAIEDRIIRYFRNHFDQEEQVDYYKPVRIGVGAIFMSNMKVKGIEIKHQQLKNILIQIDHT